MNRIKLPGRLVVVYNPHSSRFHIVERQVLRVLDLDEVAGLVGPRPVSLVNPTITRRQNWATRLYERLGCPKRYSVMPCLRPAVERVLAD